MTVSMAPLLCLPHSHSLHLLDLIALSDLEIIALKLFTAQRKQEYQGLCSDQKDLISRTQGNAHSYRMEIFYESSALGNQGLEVFGAEEIFTIQYHIFFPG